jgi:hypothetical protein
MNMENMTFFIIFSTFMTQRLVLLIAGHFAAIAINHTAHINVANCSQNKCGIWINLIETEELERKENWLRKCERKKLPWEMNGNPFKRTITENLLYPSVLTRFEFHLLRFLCLTRKPTKFVSLLFWKIMFPLKCCCCSDSYALRVFSPFPFLSCANL